MYQKTETLLNTCDKISQARFIDYDRFRLVFIFTNFLKSKFIISKFPFSGKQEGSLETKYSCKDYGLTFTEKWSTDNQLATTVELADKPLKGSKLVFDSTFSPQTGGKYSIGNLVMSKKRTLDFVFRIQFHEINEYLVIFS